MGSRSDLHLKKLKAVHKRAVKVLCAASPILTGRGCISYGPLPLKEHLQYNKCILVQKVFFAQRKDVCVCENLYLCRSVGYCSGQPLHWPQETCQLLYLAEPQVSWVIRVRAHPRGTRLKRVFVVCFHCQRSSRKVSEELLPGKISPPPTPPQLLLERPSSWAFLKVSVLSILGIVMPIA